MKRAREQSSSSGMRAGTTIAARPAAPAAPVARAAPAARAALVKSRRIGLPTSSSASSSASSSSSGAAPKSKKPSKPKAILAPLPPPPPIQPFSDESDGDGACSSSSSSSSLDARGPAPEAKRVRRDDSAPPRQVEDPGWRKRAEEILAGAPIAVGKGISKRGFAVVCSSNVNRSIMAQRLLEKHDMRAKSYGTGSQVKLPGKDARSPMSFEFGTPYVEIRDTLASENEALFRRNSVLGLLERDAVTKRAPERWQALVSEEVASFDVVVCFESRVFDLVVEDLQQRDPDTFKPLHVVSMTIRDSAEDSAAASGDVLELCKMLDECDDLDTDASKLLNGFRMKTRRTVLHQVCHI